MHWIIVYIRRMRTLVASDICKCAPWLHSAGTRGRTNNLTGRQLADVTAAAMSVLDECIGSLSTSAGCVRSSPVTFASVEPWLHSARTRGRTNNLTGRQLADVTAAAMSVLDECIGSLSTSAGCVRSSPVTFASVHLGCIRLAHAVGPTI